MTKLEFMNELESLLLDIPLEEREEALRYYSGYFEDAGEDHEQEIITELASPKQVADIIKADLTSNTSEGNSRGYYTENGYKDTMSRDNQMEVVEAAKTREENSNANNSKTYNQSYQNAGKNSDQNASHNRNSNTGVVILILILAFTVGLPFTLSIIGIAIGLVAMIIGLIFGFGAAGIALICAGIALFIAGLVQMSAPLIGMAFVGAGLLVFGIGMLLTMACAALCRIVLPAMIKGFVNLCRLPFKNRSVMAA